MHLLLVVIMSGRTGFKDEGGIQNSKTRIRKDNVELAAQSKSIGPLEGGTGRFTLHAGPKRRVRVEFSRLVTDLVSRHPHRALF